jgi:hypothetical protein
VTLAGCPAVLLGETEVAHRREDPVWTSTFETLLPIPPCFLPPSPHHRHPEQRQWRGQQRRPASAGAYEAAVDNDGGAVALSAFEAAEDWSLLGVALDISVWSKDKTRRDDFLGAATVRLPELLGLAPVPADGMPLGCGGSVGATVGDGAKAAFDWSICRTVELKLPTGRIFLDSRWATHE